MGFPVSNYMLGGDVQMREFVTANEVKENGVVESYGYSEQRMQRVPDQKHTGEDNAAEDANGSLQTTVNSVQDQVPTSAEEPAEEPQKHTYASIVCALLIFTLMLI